MLLQKAVVATPYYHACLHITLKTKIIDIKDDNGQIKKKKSNFVCKRLYKLSMEAVLWR